MRKEPGGRPLRFFALLAIGWTAIRLASLPAPADMTPAALPALAARAVAPTVAASAISSAIANRHTVAPTVIAQRGAISIRRAMDDDGMIVDLMHFIHISNAFANRHYGGTAATPAGGGFAMAGPVQPTPLPVPLPSPPTSAADRWRASAWTLWRPGGSGEDIARLGRLGGSQAGVRIDRDIVDAGHYRLAAYARATTAFQRPVAPEAALGLSFQPDRAIPVTMAVERRAAIGEGGRNATAAFVTGGFGPAPIKAGIEATAYAQAGVVGIRRRDAFIDGKLSLLAPLAGQLLRLGGTVSGGAQPGVHRVDIGPEVQVRLPLPKTNARLSVEWRERIAGRAVPSSGLAITLAADF